MNVDRRVIAFLRSRRGKIFCVQCISMSVPRPQGGHINSTQAANAVRGLEDVAEFIVENNECSNCGEFRKVVGVRPVILKKRNYAPNLNLIASQIVEGATGPREKPVEETNQKKPAA